MTDRPIGTRRRASIGLAARIIAVLGLSAGAAKADDSYDLGHGYDIGPFNFAGYSAIVANVPDQGLTTLSIEDLSLFVSGHVTPLLNPFVEAELTHFDLTHAGLPGRDQGDGTFVIERLYDDAELTGDLTLRLGKMLAPVGEWNVVHAAPLVLSTTRPAVTNRNFSEYLTGMALLYQDAEDEELPSFQVYWQPDREAFERPSSITYDQYRMVEGLHAALPLALLDQVGVSFQQSRDTKGVAQSLFGLDFQYRLQDVTFQGEWTYSNLHRDPGIGIRQDEWGGYVSTSYAIDDAWSTYAWFEEFSERTAGPAARDVLFGVAWRPHSAVVIKLEALANVGGPAVNPTGLFASWSVLF